MSRQEGDDRVVKGADHLGQWVIWLTSALAGALIAGALILGIGLFEQKVAQRNNCQEIEVVKKGLRETLEASELFATTSHVRTPKEKATIVAFYRDALGRLKPRKC